MVDAAAIIPDMAQTPSTMMMSLGAKAPAFELPDPFHRVWSLADFEGAPALLVAFICNHCPFVKHVRSGFAELAKEYQERGVAVVGISSNDIEAYPDDRRAWRQAIDRLRGAAPA